MVEMTSIGGQPVERITPEHYQLLRDIGWPASVREKDYPWVKLSPILHGKEFEISVGRWGRERKIVNGDEPLLLFCVIEQMRRNYLDEM